MADVELIENLPFTTRRTIGAKACIGLVVLASDYTLEHKFREVLRLVDEPGLAFYHSRISNTPNITTETLAAMVWMSSPIAASRPLSFSILSKLTTCPSPPNRRRRRPIRPKPLSLP